MTGDTLLADVAPGDRFLLCSDGLSNYATANSALASQLGNLEFESVADHLVDFANTAVGHDNITVVAIRLEVDAPEREVAVTLGREVQVPLKALSSVFLFGDLPLAKLPRVLEIYDVRGVEAGAEVLRKGEALAGLVVVADGVVEVVKRGDVLLELGAGDHVGAWALLRARPARGTLKTRTAAKLLELDGANFRALAHRRPWLGVDLMLRLARRLATELDWTYDALESTSSPSDRMCLI